MYNKQLQKNVESVVDKILKMYLKTYNNLCARAIPSLYISAIMIIIDNKCYENVA